MDNKNILLAAVAAIAVVIALAAVFAASGDSGEQQTGFQTKEVLEPGDCIITEVEMNGTVFEMRFIVMEALADDTYKYMLDGAGELSVGEETIDQMTGDSMISGPAYTDVRETDRYDYQSYMGMKASVEYTCKYDADGEITDATVVADAETGLVYEITIQVLGVEVTQKIVRNTFIDIFGPSEYSSFSDTPKTFDQIVPGDFYSVSTVAVSEDGTEEFQNGFRVTVVDVDREAGTVMCMKQHEGTFADPTEYYEVSFEEFMEGVVMDPASEGLVAGEETVVSTGWGYRECVSYTHPDGVQEIFLGKDTNVLYANEYAYYDSFRQYLDSTSLFGGVQVEVPELEDTLKTADQLEVGDTVSFNVMTVDGDYISVNQLTYVIQSIEGDKVVYADYDGNVYETTGEGFLDLLRGVPDEGTYDSVRTEIVDTESGPRLCDVYYRDGQAMQKVGTDSGICYYRATVENGEVVQDREVAYTTLFV